MYCLAMFKEMMKERLFITCDDRESYLLIQHEGLYREPSSAVRRLRQPIWHTAAERIP